MCDDDDVCVTDWYPQSTHEADGRWLRLALHHHNGLHRDSYGVSGKQQLSVMGLRKRRQR